MKKTPLQQNEVRAVSKYIRMSPTKVRRVLRQIQGKNYSEALLLLEFMPYVSCDPIIKVFPSLLIFAKKLVFSIFILIVDGYFLNTS